MKNIFVSGNNNFDAISVCICDDTGTHYLCSTCGNYYDDEMNALICCMED